MSLRLIVLPLLLSACGERAGGGAADAGSPDATTTDGSARAPALPLSLVADVGLPGGATRFDYQEIDPVGGQLVVAHMNDDAVLILDLHDGSLRKQLTGIPTPRGVAVADELG